MKAFTESIDTQHILQISPFLLRMFGGFIVDMVMQKTG